MRKIKASTHLMTELVAGEGEHLQIASELVFEFVHLKEVSRGRASERRRVQDQDYFSIILTELDCFTYKVKSD